MKKKQQRGFTLLEALVATAVLGASVAALLGLLSGALRNAARLEAPEQAGRRQPGTDRRHASGVRDTPPYVFG